MYTNKENKELEKEELKPKMLKQISGGSLDDSQNYVVVPDGPHPNPQEGGATDGW